MPSSYTNLIYHVVFGTKAGRIGADWREELYRYVGGVVMRQRGAVHEIGGCEDHVHLLASIKAEPSLATMVRMIKTGSSKWIRRRRFVREPFSWREGYVAFSVSPSQIGRVRRYIRGQERQHLRVTLETELELLLKRHGVTPSDPSPATQTHLVYHIVFGTKYRAPIIQPPLRDDLYRTIGNIFERQRGTLHEIGGVADHVHLLAEHRADPSPAAMLRLIKANSSKWINEQKLLPERFAWQEGYAAFTVSASQMSRVRRYIQNQEEHHRRYTFDAELAGLIKRHPPRRGEIG